MRQFSLDKDGDGLLSEEDLERSCMDMNELSVTGIREMVTQLSQGPHSQHLTPEQFRMLLTHTKEEQLAATAAARVQVRELAREDSSHGARFKNQILQQRSLDGVCLDVRSTRTG